MTIGAGATRRAFLRLAGTAASLSIVGSCGERPTDRTAGSAGPGGGGRGHLIFLTTKDGVSVIDHDGRVVTPPTAVVAATPGWWHAVTARSAGAGTRVVVEDLADRRVIWESFSGDQIEPRVVSDNGHLVASVTPGGAGIYGLHEPGGRERTTVVVADSGRERVRLDLAGNLEPEVFSPDGNRLFVLDYVPAARPERFRVRAVDLTTRRLVPLLSRARRPVPLGAEPQLRAHRIDSVYDGRRAMLFRLYSHQADALAFVHCLDVREGWTHRVDLPAPFGRERPGVHAIALSPSGDRLCVVHAPSASVADLDPDRLVVTRITTLAAAGLSGKPNAQITASGRLVVHVDTMVVATGPRREIPTPGQARGLVLGTGDDIWAGHPNGVVRFDLDSGAEIGRVSVPDLFVVKHVRATG